MGLLFTLFAGAASAEEADHLTVRAWIEPATGIIKGELTWRFTNTTALPLAEAWLYRYPDSYATEPELDDILRERVYPSNFEAAYQELGTVLVTLEGVRDQAAVPQEFTFDEVPLIKIPLPRPLAPGETVSITGPYSTVVPRKYGTFGRFRGVLTVNGGLAPMPLRLAEDGWRHDEPPASLPRTLELSVPDDLAVNVAGVTLDPGDPGFLRAADRPVTIRHEPAGAGRRLVTLEADDLRWVSLTVRKARPRLHTNLPLTRERAISWFGVPPRRVQKRWLHRVADAVDQTLEGTGLGLGDVVLVEAPLRRKLVELGEGVVYVSDRFFEVELPFWRYHDLHLARALLATSLEPRARLTEPPRFEPLVTHGVTWRLVPGYLKHRWRNHENLRRILDQLSFLPEVDNILQTPVFPFADQIFDNPWVVDPLRADVRRFNRPLRTGRTLLVRLEDRLGADVLEEGVASWLRSDEALIPLLEAQTGARVLDLAEHWMGAYARVNLRIEDLQRTRTDAGWRTKITVRRELLEGDGVDEVVEVRLDPAFGKKHRQTLIWEGQDEVASWEVESKRRIASVVVDPRGRILELDEDGISLKRDNRFPRATKVTGMAYIISADSVGGAEAYAFVGFRPRHNLQHQARVRVWTDSDAWVGAGPSYTHYFGPPRIGSYRQHRITASIDFQWLNEFYRPTDAPLLLNGQFSYVFDTRSGAYSPLRGERIAATVFAGRDFALEGDASRTFEESAFVGIDFEARKLLLLHAWHVLALRTKVGIVAGDVEHRQFALGGNSDLRGTPANHAVGRFRTMGSVEWRHYFIKDADVPLPLMRGRALQGALFVEGGLVGTDLDKPPQGSDLGVSIGYAVRAYFDWGGVLPAMGGVEIAWSPNVGPGRVPIFAPPEEWPELPFQLYFVASQSF